MTDHVARLCNEESTTDQVEQHNAVSRDFAGRYRRMTRMSHAFLEVLEELHGDLCDGATLDLAEGSASVAEISDQLADAIVALVPLDRPERREPFSV